MEELEKDRQNRLGRELEQSVNQWISNNFNHIQLNLIESALRNNNEYLMEYIEPAIIDYEMLLKDNGYEDEFEEYLCDEYENKEDRPLSLEDEAKVFMENNHQEIIDYESNEQFPMWNTLFEYKSSFQWNALREAAQEVGCGIINSTEFTNDMIFMMSAGHSFMSAYWIPMYLKLIHGEAEKYKDIKYDHL